MASQILFKIACPSCDAQVPVRDPRLVGKKVECPKCKYRFVVEEPGGFEAVDDEAEPAKAKAKARKKGSNTPLLVGAGVGAIALAVLGVVGYFMMTSGPETPKPTSKPPALAQTSSSDSGPQKTDTTTKAPDATPEAKSDSAQGQPAAPAAANVLPIPAANESGDISNYLPNGTRLAVNFNLDRLRFSTLGEQLFESRTGLRPGTFKEKLGIGIEEMKRLVRGEDTETNGGWSFNVLRTNNPINFDEVKKVLRLEKGPKSPIKGREYFVIPPNPVLDHLTDALKTELENRQARMSKREDAAGPLGLMLLDQTTVVIATLDQLTEFLDANAKFAQQSRPTSPTGDDPNAGGSTPQSPPAKPGGRGHSESFSTMAFQAPGGDQQLTENATWLTIDPALKAMFDRLEDPKNPPLLTVVADLQRDPKLVDRIRNWTGVRSIGASNLRVFGMTLLTYSFEKFYGTASVHFFRENDAKQFEEAFKKFLPQLGQMLSQYLRLKIDTEGGDASVANPPSGTPGAPGTDSGIGGSGGLVIPGMVTMDEGPPSKLIFQRRGPYVSLKAEFNLLQYAYDKIYAMSEAIVTRMRGMVDMANPTPLWPELVAAALKLRDEKGQIPRAAFPRGETTGGRLARHWAPQTRVSWMAALLPHLGHDDVFRSIERDKSWSEDRNLKAGMLLVPPFLDPRYPDRSWYANLDRLGGKILGATHYVGCAGVGLEAPDYKPDDPANVKKLGAFGYDRVTGLKDVADGLGNTIYMLQVPPSWQPTGPNPESALQGGTGFQRPWIAGGGATVMGVPETKSIAPFSYNHQGKRGTFVLMMDGSVRFVPATVSDDVFKALSTIKGGEDVGNLDAVAPKVNARPGPELKTESSE